MRHLLRMLLAALFAAAGSAHLLLPGAFLAIVLGWVPMPEAVVFWTGIAENMGAIGLLVQRLQRAAAWSLGAYTVCVFPANVTQAWLDLVALEDADRRTLPLAYCALRLLLQPVIVWCCLFAGAIVDRPIRRHRARE